MLLLNCCKKNFLQNLMKESYPSLGEEDFEKISSLSEEVFDRMLEYACDCLNKLNIYLDRNYFVIFEEDQTIEYSYYFSGINYYYGLQEGFRYKGIYELLTNIILYLLKH